MTEFDPGPPPAIAAHLAALPSYQSRRELFWYDWGPIFYRGRLDGSARLLGIASDPGPTERIPGRTLVGDAGQRVQGFLSKLGLTRSYVLANAYAYALIPARAPEARPLLSEPDHLAWRNGLYDLLVGSELQAIVAFGAEARAALDLWSPRPDVLTLKVPHPSSHDEARLVREWHAAIEELRTAVSPDPDGDPTLPNYGSRWHQRDYARIPARDLPFGLPPWFGDDAWARASGAKGVERPRDDRMHTLVWRAPPDQP
jgi:hypothetical protein